MNGPHGVFIRRPHRDAVNAAIANARLTGAPRDLLRQAYITAAEWVALPTRDADAALTALAATPGTGDLGDRLDALRAAHDAAERAADLVAIAAAVGVLHNP